MKEYRVWAFARSAAPNLPALEEQLADVMREADRRGYIIVNSCILKQENVLTPRQKDIIDTEKEMLKSPFDRNTAIGQVEKNCMSYPELALGVTVPIAIRGRSLEQMTNDDILKILQLQFGILMAEEGVRGIRNQ